MPRPSFAFRSLAAALTLACAALLSSCENPAGSDGTGKPARLDIVSGDLQTGTVGAELPQALVARVVDGKGKPVTGQVVNFRVTAGGGSVFAGSAVTNEQGEARERWTLGIAAGDTQRVEARAVDAATGQALVFATFRAIGRADAPAAIVPMGESVRTGTAGFPLGDSLAVKVLDRFGNGVGGATVAWTVRRGGGSLSPPTSTADATGVAKTQWTLGTFVDSTQVVEAAAAVGISTAFVASSGIPAGATLVVRGGQGQTGMVGTTLAQPVKVALLLPDGRPVVGAVIAWSLGSTGGRVSSSTSTTDVNGEAIVQWTLPTVSGTASLWAETPGAMPLPFTATATPGPAVSLARVSGNGQTFTPGVPMADSLVVRAVDAHGNGVPGVAVTWSTSNGTLSPASTTTRADGTAKTRWTPATAGASSATATAAGLPPVTFNAQAQSTITIGFFTPGDAVVTQNVLEVWVLVQSSYSVTGVTATLGDTTVVLQRDAATPTYWRGRILLTALPRGTYTVSVTANDATGATRTEAKTFTLDRPPVVTILSPVDGAVVPAGGTVRFIAVCRDDDPAGCASLRLEKSYSEVLGTGKDSVDVTFTAGSVGQQQSLYAWATDARGTTGMSSVSYLVESGPRLVQVASVGHRVYDFDGERALYLGQSRTDLHIRTLASGADVTLTTQGAPGLDQSKLTPHGALFVQGGVPNLRVKEWRDGAVVDAGSIGYVERNRAILVNGITVEGKWAVWHAPGAAIFRDLDAGTNTVINDGVSDLAPNGDLILIRRPTSSTAEIYRYRNGATTLVAAAEDAGAARTDGANVVAYLKDAGGKRVELFGPAGPDTLVSTGPDSPITLNHDVVDGWVAFSRGSGEAVKVWLRSPAGVEYEVSPFWDHAVLRSLGSDGQVVFEAAGRLWYYRPGQSPVDIASATGKVLWRNGELYVIFWNTVFRVIR